jgi:hypothetical protein
MCAHHFLGLQRHHPPVVLGQRYENPLQDLLEGPKEVETINHACQRQKPMHFQHGNTRPHTSVASSAAVEHIRFKLFHTLLTAQFGTILILVRSCQETSQRNSFHMWWRSSGCCGKMVFRTAWRVLQWWIQKKVARHWQGCMKRGRLCGIVRYRNRVHIMSYILCFVLIHCLGVNIETWDTFCRW